MVSWTNLVPTLIVVTAQKIDDQWMSWSPFSSGNDDKNRERNAAGQIKLQQVEETQADVLKTEHQREDRQVEEALKAKNQHLETELKSKTQKFKAEQL